MLIGRTEPHSDGSLVHLAASEGCSRAIVAEMLVNCRTLPGFAVRFIAVHSLACSLCLWNEQKRWKQHSRAEP